MTEEDEPNIVTSSKSQHVVVDGYPFSIEIYRLEYEKEWTLEVVDPDNASHVWEATFKSDKDARNEAIKDIEAKGAVAFIRGDEDNVIPFSRGRSMDVPPVGLKCSRRCSGGHLGGRYTYMPAQVRDPKLRGYLE